MFYLDSGVHFHEIKLSGLIQKKFYGSCTFIACCLCCPYCCLTHFLSQIIRDCDTWRLFDHFLVTSLNRAVSFSQMNYISVFIRKNLHFNMSGILHKPFQIHGIIGKGMDRLLLCCLKQFGKFLFISGYTHSFSTAAC